MSAPQARPNSTAARGARTRPASSRLGVSRSLDAVAPRVSLGDVVAERLREAILHDELTPGQHLREEEISERLQVSRGPVRDAFLALEREGLVRLFRHRGAKVVELSTEDLGEVYSLRLSIEELAARLAIRRHDADDLAVLEGSVNDLRTGLKRKLSEQEAARLDVEFHDGIFRAAHHERLYASWSAIRMQVYWFLCSRNIANADWRSATVRGHQDILDLIRSTDEAKAVDAVRVHITTAYARIITQLTAARVADQAASPADGGSGRGADTDDVAEIRRIAESFLLT